MVSWKRVLGFVITAVIAFVVAVFIGNRISEQFGFNPILTISLVISGEIVIVGLARLFLPNGTSDEERQLTQWRDSIRRKANRIIHQWESNSVENYEGREEIQREISTACKELDDLLSEPPSKADEDTIKLLHKLVDSCDEFEDLQTRTKAGPVDMTKPDPEVPTIGMSEDEIKRQFVNHGSTIVDNANQLIEHIEESQDSGLLPV